MERKLPKCVDGDHNRNPPGCGAKNGNSSANLAQFDSLFKDGDLQPTLPQGERGRQATNSAAHDRNLKLL
jgi:hypothetical protein